MTITRIDNSRDIVDGAAVVYDGRTTSTYDATDRNRRWPDLDSNRVALEGQSRYLAGEEWEQENLPVAASDTSLSVNGFGPYLHYAAGSGTRHVLYNLEWSFDATPVSGYLSVHSPSGTVVFGPHYLTASGPGSLVWDDGLRCGRDRDLYIELRGSVSGVVQSSLSLTGRRIE